MTQVGGSNKPTNNLRSIFRHYPAVNLNLAFFISLSVALLIIYLRHK